MEKFADYINTLWTRLKKAGAKVSKKIKKKTKTSYILGGVIVLAVLVGILIGLTKKDKEVITEVDFPGELGTEAMTVAEVTELDMEENAHEEVNTFINAYFKALAEGNAEAASAMRSYTSEQEMVTIQKKSNYIESYQNITCYTKAGPIENSYVAYVYYEVKFLDYEPLVPSLQALFLYHDEEGNLKIKDGEMDENIAEYIRQVSTQDNVVELSNRVQVKYNEAKESDEALNQFLDQFLTRLRVEVAEELAKATVSANEVAEAEGESVSENEVEEADTEATQTVTVETVKTKTTVNVRKSDSETADKVGKATEGATYKRLEELANGWSKIEFEGKEAFVKSEFLEVVDTQTVEVSNEADNTDASDIGPAPAGKIIVKETVNIRKTASESGERLGVAYKGDTYELIMKQADGWTKIKYKGQTAYVKSDYVQ